MGELAVTLTRCSWQDFAITLHGQPWIDSLIDRVAPARVRVTLNQIEQTWGPVEAQELTTDGQVTIWTIEYVIVVDNNDYAEYLRAFRRFPSADTVREKPAIQLFLCIEDPYDQQYGDLDKQDEIALRA